MKILITGATGFIGREVGKRVALAGHDIVIISRNAEKAKLGCPFPCEVVEGDLNRESIKDEKLRDIEGVIHLAGENLADSRWTEEKKRKIYDSRVKGTTHLLASLEEAQAAVKVFVSTSASGIYGDRGDEILLEKSHQGDGFLADVCRDWERPIELAEKKKTFPGCRFAILRLGMVLSPLGGALTKLIPVFRWGIGGALGSGQQWMGWIHIDDLAQIYLDSLSKPEFHGVINAVAPETVTNKEFSRSLAASFAKRLGPSVPKAVLKVMFGELGEYLLHSQKTEAQVLHRLQFNYKFPTLKQALTQATSYFQKGQELFYSEQYLPYPKSRVFGFFSLAQNLEAITPEYLNFHVKSISTPQIQAGTLIDYRLSIRGLPFFWRTEILQWSPPDKFSDTQVKGPYSRWLHTHEFISMGKGTLMIDVVSYKLPLGIIGRLTSGSLVKKDVKNIFAFRRNKVAQLKFSN